MGFHYDGNKETTTCVAYSDANWAGDLDDRSQRLDMSSRSATPPSCLAACNIPDLSGETRIFKMISLQDNLHSVAAP